MKLFPRRNINILYANFSLMYIRHKSLNMNINALMEIFISQRYYSFQNYTRRQEEEKKHHTQISDEE